MFKKIGLTILALSIFTLTGCASMFTIGEEDFACKGNAVGGVCGDPMGIYKVKEELLEQYDKAKKDEKKDQATNKTEGKEVASAEKLNSLPVPVRKTEEVRRVYIYPFQNSKGDYVMGFYVFTIVNKGQWLMPDGRGLEDAFIETSQ